MSVAFDTFWHWRANFGGWPSNPYATTAPGSEESFALIHRPEAQGAQDNAKTVDMTNDQGWNADINSTGPAIENLPVDFGYFPNGEWWTDVSFVDPMPFSLPQFEDDLNMQNQVL